MHPDQLPISLLLVDDSAAFRHSISALLHAEPGLKVVGEAQDGVAAIRLVGELTPVIVIMDVIMPEMNGIETTRQIVALYPDVKVIALSMHTDNHFVAAMQVAGASGYVFKDCAREDLATAIRAVAGGKCFYSLSTG